jgi:hypothetical protein
VAKLDEIDGTAQHIHYVNIIDIQNERIINKLKINSGKGCLGKRRRGSSVVSLPNKKVIYFFN